MKLLLLLVVSLAAVAAVCNTKSYSASVQNDILKINHSGTFTNMKRKTYNKENYSNHCKNVVSSDLQPVFLNGSDRTVFGRKKRGDMYPIFLEWPTCKWTNGVIPFLVEENAYSDCALSSLATAMTYWEETTCIRFVSYVDKTKTPRPLLVANFLNEAGNTFANRGSCMSGVFDNREAEVGVLGTMENHMIITQTMLHELAHVMMMGHSEDSIRSRAPYRNKFEKKIKNDTAVGPWYPLSVATNVSPEGPRPLVPTDWDIWTINAFYNCTRTTRGGKPIDINNQPPKQKYMDK